MVGPNPFRGLSSYTRDDREVLFGRDDDLTVILARIFSRRTTLLFSGSGVGKTSFLNAKVAPELERRYCICSHSAWSTGDPLSCLREALRKAWAAQGFQCPEGASLLGMLPTAHQQLSGTLFILDQFEEVFQNHRDTPEFDQFVAGLCELINSETVEARVIFAMREEFLGELSAFDNKAPDLFGNYYRLKAPNRRQAKEIIEATTRSAGVGKSALLPELIEDLLRAATPGMPGTAYRSREFVSPPYLQIACRHLWEESPPTEESGFPRQYEPGGASNALRDYCKVNLDPLPKQAKEVISSAFGFLITRQGAKMAYELNSLAEHLKLDKQKLDTALSALSNVRILRRTPAPGGAVWFELYHDMYAPFLTAWAERYRAECAAEIQRARSRSGLLLKLASVLVVFAFIAALLLFRSNSALTESNSTLTRTVEVKPILDTATLLSLVDSERAALLTLAAVQVSNGAADHTDVSRILGDVLATPRPTVVANLGPIVSAAVSGGTLAALTEKGDVIAWSPDKKSVKLARVADATDIAIEPQGFVVVSRGSVRTLVAPDGKTAPYSGAAALPFDSDVMNGLLAKGSQAGSVAVTAATASAYPLSPQRSVRVGSSAVTRVRWNAGATQLLVGLDDGTAALLDRTNLDLVTRLPGSAGAALAVGWDQSGAPVTVSRTGEIRVWDLDTPLKHIRASSQALYGIAFSPDGGRLIAGSGDGSVKIVDVAKGVVIGDWKNVPPSKQVWGVAISPNGKNIASVSLDGLLNLWTASGKNYDGHSFSKSVWAVDFAPDGKSLAVALSDGNIYRVDLPIQKNTPQLIATHKDRAVAVRFSPDGSFIASAGMDHHLLLTAIRSGMADRDIGPKPGALLDISFGGTSGNWVAVADASGVADVERKSGSLTMRGHTGPVYGVACRPKLEEMATSGQDGTVRVWNMATSTELLRYSAHAGGANRVAYRPDGRIIASSGADGFIRTYAATYDDLLDLARHYIRRSLTTDECKQYLNVSPCPADLPVPAK
ncbi:WD40 repeat domain-containing protein [Paludibaculum fermentans]|uniref:WD40 repeat domain-containing protein n=1 Tax=Paludibaculum fermentans TaxID=1473598 RepID=A0A7S7NWS9_PALFE|nr:WD40 repeat domain-containing protein [Paludibaculum fermentans]QOY91200.1 WD40 repeat domain-containing protein [Paludibaculum fermentans]